MKFVELSQKLVGRAYALGVVDCFSIILDYLDEIGVDVPDEYHGQTRETYPELFRDDAELAKRVMVSFMDDNFDEIPAGRAFCGDIMLLSLAGSDAPSFLAINAGNANIIAASMEHGVTVIPLKHYTIERVYRCRRQSH